METKFQEVTVDQLQKVVGSDIVLVCGMPGSGKDYFADTVLSTMGEIVMLDSLGYKSEGKWIVDLKSLKEIASDNGGIFYVGISDNLREVCSTLTDIYPGRNLCMLWISPAPDLFRRANELKNVHADKSVPSAWKQIWKKRSKLSDHAITKLDENEMLFLSMKVGAELVYIYRNVLHTSPAEIQHGWHMWKEKSPYNSISFEVIDVLLASDYSYVRVIFKVSEKSGVYAVVKVFRDEQILSVKFSDRNFEDEINYWTSLKEVHAAGKESFLKLRAIAVERAVRNLNHALSLANKLKTV